MTTALVRLVVIGRLRNGTPLYMPEPEYRLILEDFGGDELGLFDRLEDAVAFVDFRRQLVADQQRVYDAIALGEVPKPGHWQCTNANCARVYAEYVNGCVRCYDEDRLHYSVRELRPFELQELPTFAQIMRLGA